MAEEWERRIAMRMRNGLKDFFRYEQQDMD